MSRQIKTLILIFIAWTFLVLGVDKLSNYFIPNRTSYELPYGLTVVRKSLILPFLNFDGRNYLDVAAKGYFQKDIYNLRAFFPFFPILIYLLSLGDRLNIVYIGLTIEVFAAGASTYLLYKLAKKEIGETNSIKAVLLMLIFPTSFYLLSYYTESTYLLLSLLVFWYLIKKKFAFATLFCALASATRIAGPALCLVVVLEGLRNFIVNKKFPWIVLLSPLGLVIFSLYNLITVGDPFIYVHTLFAWQKAFSVFGPIEALVNGLKNIIAGPLASFDSPFVYPISVIEFISLVFFITMIIFSYRKIRFMFWIYLVANAYLSLSGGILQSLPRLLLINFPIYLFLAKSLQNIRFIIYCVISFTLLMFLSAIFLRGYWVA